MTRRAVTLLFAWLAVTGAPGLAAATVLADHGPSSEYFHNPYLDLYFFDPAVFADFGRANIDRLVTHSTTWRWANPGEVHALVSCESPAGLSLVDVMGPSQFTLSGGGPRWVAYYDDPAEPNGLLLESDFGPDFNLITASGTQGGAENWGAGGWVVSDTDPLLQPALENFGEADWFFHDPATGLYWHDPAHFVGETRDAIDAWLIDDPDARWATAAEVYGLLGKFSDDGGPLTDILGPPQFIVGVGGARWIGYYDQATQPNGLLIQADYAPYHLLTNAGTQAFAETWNPGAWVVSTLAPVPTTRSSWGGVKAGYR